MSDPGAATAADAHDTDHPVLLFDGVCNLCNAFLRFVVRFDADGMFRFAPVQSPVGQDLLDRHGESQDPTDPDTVVLVEDGQAYTKSAAALRVLRRLDGPFPLLYPLVAVPEPLRDGVYDLVARVRYPLFGRTEECQLPAPELRERFVERSLDFR